MGRGLKSSTALSSYAVIALAYARWQPMIKKMKKIGQQWRITYIVFTCVMEKASFPWLDVARKRCIKSGFQ